MAKRRGYREGSITQRGDGRWMGRVELGWQDGKRQRKTLYGRTRQEVADKVRKALTQAEDGIPFPNERQTVSQFLQSWLEQKKTQLRPRAFLSYQQTVGDHLEPGLGKIPVAKLTPQQLAAWFHRHQTDDHASARTIRYARVVLRAALNQALRWSLVTRNVATLIDAPRYQPREIQPLSPREARELVAAVEDHRLGPLFSVTTALGLRIGEALGLAWKHVNLERGTLSIVQGLERSGGDRGVRLALNKERRALLKLRRKATDRAERCEIDVTLKEIRKRLKEKGVRQTLHFTEPKSVRSRRTITLPAIAITALKKHRTRQKKERLAAGGDWKDSGLVFTTPLGTALDLRNVHREFKAILTAAHLPNIRLHDLRHTAATLLLAQGVDPRTIMETLGHSQISLTLNTYSHVVPALQEMAAEKMNAILSKG
jgi:integrase